MIKSNTYNKKHPWISIVLVLLLYIITLVLSDVLLILFSSVPPTVKVFLKIGLFSLLCFLIIPFILRLPSGKNSFRQLISLIGLSNSTPFCLLIIVSFSSYLIFVLSQLSGTLIYHATQSANYIFDLSRHSLFESNTIISGIFEEIIFRGIIMTLLLNHYSERKSILFSAVVFAGIHSLNILNPQLQMFWVFSQVIWSFGFGFMYGYIFVKTKSLTPLILLHYLINGMVNVWFYGLDKNDFNSSVYGIPFFGLIPAGLAILWVMFLYRRLVIKT